MIRFHSKNCNIVCVNEGGVLPRGAPMSGPPPQFPITHVTLVCQTTSVFEETEVYHIKKLKRMTRAREVCGTCLVSRLYENDYNPSGRIPV